MGRVSPFQRFLEAVGAIALSTWAVVMLAALLAYGGLIVKRIRRRLHRQRSVVTNVQTKLPVREVIIRPGAPARRSTMPTPWFDQAQEIAQLPETTPWAW